MSSLFSLNISFLCLRVSAIFHHVNFIVKFCLSTSVVAFYFSCMTIHLMLYLLLFSFLLIDAILFSFRDLFSCCILTCIAVSVLWYFNHKWKFSKMAKYDVTGIGMNLREVPDDNGSVKLKVLGIILDGPAHSAGVRQVLLLISVYVVWTHKSLMLAGFLTFQLLMLNVNPLILPRHETMIRILMSLH